MAVGGRKDPSYISSLEHGNDFLYDYTCSLCEADGKNKEAVKFCLGCSEYLCGNCLNNHNKFPKMKSHKVVEPSKHQDITRTTNQTPLIAPTIKICCEKHHGKPLDMFCRDHNEVCCAVCVALNHGLCEGRYYIPDISKDFKKNEEYKQQEANGKSILSQLDKFQKKRRADMALYKTQKDEIYKHFKQLREDVLKQFNEIEKHSVELVEKQFQQNVANAIEDIKKSEEVYRSLKSSEETLKNETDDSQSFVLAKRAKKAQADFEKIMHGMLATKAPPMDFKIEEAIRKSLKKFKSLGHFYTAARCDVFSVQNQDEQYRCDVSSICQLEGGDFIIADAANKSIKRLGSSFLVKNRCRLSSQPRSVCKASDIEIAVSMCDEKSIQFVSVNGEMKPSRSFVVNDTCTGLASVGDVLYVGLLNRKQIQTFDHSGFPGTTIDLAKGVPWNIAVSKDSSIIFVAALKDGVFAVDLKTQKLINIDLPGANIASSVAVAAKGALLVACCLNNCIMQYSTVRKSFLTSDDGINAPQTIFYDQNNQLIVASRNEDVIRVFPGVDKLLI